MSDTDWYESWLGRERFAKFVHAARGDRARAIALVDWDREVGGEIMKGLGEWELAMRNSYDAVITDWWTGTDHWLRDPTSPVLATIMRDGRDLNFHNKKNIGKAISRLKEKATPANIVANLSLDFWRYLTAASREKSLWVPALHKAFPRGTPRFAADQQIDGLYRLRNRIAHREPIFHMPVAALVEDLLGSCERIRPELGRAIKERDPFRDLWEQYPLN
ncbi:hypothetical protein F4553_002104 [Allocatelliglobosispora scoriae]|uniref:Abi-like protein n=1 Tax=Allocatelliglobosispora scoriae TaxID=643052 RepID=A0A841BM40_9ACTN|nr:hypothetical protein [Allocatelliglobosispora scoriae]MBB5868725.1 hypothetical protein [Allocatelliglobosispora scoriae]